MSNQYEHYNFPRGLSFLEEQTSKKEVWGYLTDLRHLRLIYIVDFVSNIQFSKSSHSHTP